MEEEEETQRNSSSNNWQLPHTLPNRFWDALVADSKNQMEEINTIITDTFISVGEEEEEEGLTGILWEGLKEDGERCLKLLRLQRMPIVIFFLLIWLIWLIFLFIFSKCAFRVLLWMSTYFLYSPMPRSTAEVHLYWLSLLALVVLSIWKFFWRLEHKSWFVYNSFFIFLYLIVYFKNESSDSQGNAHMNATSSEWSSCKMIVFGAT